MSTVIERVQAARKSLFGGGLLGETFLGQVGGFNLQGLLGGQQSIRAMTASKLATLLKVSPPAATSTLPVIETVRTKVTTGLSYRPAIPAGAAPMQKQAFSPPTIVSKSKAQFG
jgi:hypothetical protein